MNAEKPKPWSWSTGEYGKKVRVYQTPSGWIYGAVGLGKGKYRELALRTKDKAVAKRWAKAQVDQGRPAADPTPYLDRVLAAYLPSHALTITRGGQVNDSRCSSLFLNLWGEKFDLRQLGAEQWEDLIARRTSGEVDAHGHPIADRKKRRPVNAWSTKADCQWLRSLVRWAATHKDEYGRYYLPKGHPILDLPLPKGPKPQRAVMTTDRYRRLRAAALQVTMERRTGGKRVPVPSYLPALLDLLHGTGRRVSAVLGLMVSDLRLTKTPERPHGEIAWRAELDKERQGWATPISREVRKVLHRILRQRPMIGGSALVFPRPDDPSRPVSRETAYAWFRRAEELAGLEHLPQGGFHQIRRSWATARKTLPIKDVAAVGGWKQVDSLLECYTHVDADTELQVVEHRAEVRRVHS